MDTNLTITICASCETELGEDDPQVQHEDETYCEECFDELFACCPDCGEAVDADDLHTVDPGSSREQAVCGSCLGCYQRCDDCGAYISEHRVGLLTDSVTYCEDCADGWVVCGDCGAVARCEGSHYHYDENSGYTYCSDCREDAGGINSYSYKPEPVFYGEGSLYMGVELEVDGGSPLGEAVDAITGLAEEVYLKADSSLNRGFEVVSHPATLEYHTFNLKWKAVMDIASDCGYKSHNTTTCGLHVHVNRNYFGRTELAQDLNIAKLLILVNNLWDQMVTLSRRHYDQLDHWAKKVDLDISPRDSRQTILHKAKDCKYKGRYYAINLENYSTIEFRMFRGTLNYDTFLATLQLVQELCRYAKRHSLPAIQQTGWADFRMTCKGTRLVEYMTQKGL